MKDFSNSQDCWHPSLPSYLLPYQKCRDEMAQSGCGWYQVPLWPPVWGPDQIKLARVLYYNIKAARKSALATVVSVASLVTEPYQHSTSPQQSSPHIFSVPGLPLSHLSPFPLPPPSTDQHNQTSRLIVPGSWRGRYPAQSTVRYSGVVHNCYHQDVCKLHNCLVHSANLVLLWNCLLYRNTKVLNDWLG